MGQSLTAPIELVLVQRQASKTYRAAAAEMQGYRSGHEDAHALACGDVTGGFYVLDGHGGKDAALIGAPKLKEQFAPILAKGRLPEDREIETIVPKVDKMLRDHFKEYPDQDSGATMVGAFVARQKDGTFSVKLMNAGDSRAVVVHAPDVTETAAPKIRLEVPEHLEDLKGDEEAVKEGFAAVDCEWPLVQETVDHKPSHPTEKARISAAGGWVSEDDPPRLDGNLAVSRGLGDFEYKVSEEVPPGEQKVSSIPDIYEIHGLAAGSIICICCDGVWDVLTSHEVGSMVRKELCKDADADLGAIAASIVRASLDRRSGDNITAMVVQMVGDEDWAEETPKDELMYYDKMKIKADSEDALDAEAKRSYEAFAYGHGFAAEPLECGHCNRWLQTMFECPCKEVFYCSKSCQKKGWKKHKLTCKVANGKKK